MAFSDNIWWTRKARIQAEKRLLNNSFQSQLLLLWYSFSGVAVAIFHLKTSASSAVTELGGIAWVVYSVLALCMSGFINGLSFKERAGLIKECYETLNTLYLKAKEVECEVPYKALSKVGIISEFNQVLGVCENHKDVDYYKALLIESALDHSKSRVLVDKSVDEAPNSEIQFGLDRSPTFYVWLYVIWGMLKNITMLLGLYSLPIVIFFWLEYASCQP
jgi:hypothetical protein